MSHFTTLLRNELRLLLFAPSTYAASALFVLLMGFLYILGLEEASRMPQPRSPLEAFLQSFWIPVLFMVPMLTMRSFSEEKRQGTLERLLSTPITTLELVLAKFSGAYLLYIALWAVTLAFPFIVERIAPATVSEGALLSFNTVIGGYSFIALSGMLYVAIGVMSSCLTRSQLIAAMITFSLLFGIIICGRLLNMASDYHMTEAGELTRLTIDYLHTFRHYDDFINGIIDSRPFLFYFVNTIWVLGLSVMLIESKSHK